MTKFEAVFKWTYNAENLTEAKVKMLLIDDLTQTSDTIDEVLDADFWKVREVKQ